MDEISKIIRNTNEDNQDKVDWTKVWGSKYPILKRYHSEVDVDKYAKEIRRLFDLLQNEYGYSELDAMLVLKDILAHEYLDNKNCIGNIIIEFL